MRKQLNKILREDKTLNDAQIDYVMVCISLAEVQEEMELKEQLLTDAKDIINEIK